MIDRLLRGGADPNIYDNTGSSPLHVAAGFGSTTCVSALVAAGGNLNRKTASAQRLYITQFHRDMWTS
jgi:ankyrin repeat protein